MQQFFITGVSRGIGRALAARVLDRYPDAQVTGVGRGSSIEHPRYRHVRLDLRDMDAVRAFSFPPLPGAQRIVLVNNAGSLTVKPLGRANAQDLIDEYLVDLVAPTVLINSFLRAYADHPAERLVVNISSGAATRPMDGWAAYCASKAGIDMLSRTAALEQQLHGGGVRVLAVAPGVVDTEMQAVIRQASADDFSRVGEFVGFKQGGALADPAAIARKLCRVMDEPALTPDVLVSLREIPDA